jgi:acetyl-CoA carboxylase biotin carboxyl carrier protein
MPTKKKTSQAKPVPSSTARSSSQLDLIRDLAGILNETGLTEIEIDHQGARVRVSKTVHAHIAPMAAHAPAAPQPHAAPAAASSVAAPAVAGSDLSNALKSPMVGTAYLASSPAAPPFVEIGTKVKEGQTVLTRFHRRDPALLRAS